MPDKTDLTIVEREPPSALAHITASRLLSIINSAESGDSRPLFNLYRDIIASDTHILSEFSNRKRAITGDTVMIRPTDKTDGDALAAAETCKKLLGTKLWADAVSHLLNATMFPVAVLEKTWRPAAGAYEFAGLNPVRFDRLKFREGRVLVCVAADPSAASDGDYIEADAKKFVVHRGHDMPIPDEWGGPFRAVLFWWLFKNMDRNWWVDALERFGMPIIVGKYEDDAGRQKIRAAIEWARRMLGLAISKETELTFQQVNTQDLSQSHSLFIELCNKEISKAIVGETETANVEAAGLGGAAAILRARVRSSLRRADGAALAITIRDQVFTQMMRYAGKSPDIAPRIVFGSDDAEETYALVSLFESLDKVGLEPDEEALKIIADRTGFGVRRKGLPAAPPSNPAAFAADPHRARATPHNADPPEPSKDAQAALAGIGVADAKMLEAIVANAKSPAEATEQINAYVAARAPIKEGIIEAAMGTAAAEADGTPKPKKKGKK